MAHTVIKFAIFYQIKVINENDSVPTNLKENYKMEIIRKNRRKGL